VTGAAFFSGVGTPIMAANNAASEKRLAQVISNKHL
jgi:hypothetical protein